MPTPEDIQANAEYFRLADEFVVAPGGANKNNFAKVDLIVSLAKSVGADAVWPGWGHASENPALPNALDAAGIIFMVSSFGRTCRHVFESFSLRPSILEASLTHCALPHDWCRLHRQPANPGLTPGTLLGGAQGALQ